MTLPNSWLQIERNGKTLVFGKDSAGTFLAIYQGDIQGEQLARFETSLAEIIGLMELWKRA